MPRKQARYAEFAKVEGCFRWGLQGAILLYRGSRKHVLDWTGSSSFLDEFAQLLSIPGVVVSSSAPFIPRGIGEPREARLERDGTYLLPNTDIWPSLQDWWLVHKRAANTPNWDIALGCSIDGAYGLILVEAKANVREIPSAGKPLHKDASSRSRENHERIGAAIDEARLGLAPLAPGVGISRDAHYQFSNRIAFSWKLSTMGVPVVLVYLGFTGDTGILDAGPMFDDDAHWQSVFRDRTKDAFPSDRLNTRLDTGASSLLVVSRSRQVTEPSPPPRWEETAPNDPEPVRIPWKRESAAGDPARDAVTTTGLAPSTSPEIRCLVLGTVPGRDSIQRQQYYANGRNAFWRIADQLFGIPTTLSYPQRMHLLNSAGVALWDVLESCQRQGSSDSKIVRGSEVPNDLASFAAAQPHLRVVALNGNKATRLFRKYLQPQLLAASLSLDVLELPSTSPANTQSTFEQKLGSWQAVAEAVRRHL